MIPVLVCPGYNRFDLMDQMLSTIDHPVGRLLIVDNAATGYQPPALPTAQFVRVFAPPFTSLGYAGSINFGILQTPDAPWWMWTNHDVTYGPGDLAEIAARMAGGAGPKMLGGYFWGAVNRDWVKVAGLLDEDFYPIYFDDTEYHHRYTRLGLEAEGYDGSIRHGADGKPGSLTIHSDPRLLSANGSTFPANERRYIRKWGGPPGAERYDRPWNGEVPPPPDLDHRAMAQAAWQR